MLHFLLDYMAIKEIESSVLIIKIFQDSIIANDRRELKQVTN